MKVIGIETLKQVEGISAKIDLWISIWRSELESCSWHNQMDVREQFPRIKIMDKTFFLFPIPDSKYEVKTMICFSNSIVFVQDISKKS